MIISKLARLLTTLILVTSCASQPQKQFDTILTEGRCEEAMNNLPADRIDLIEETQTAAGKVASYTFTGLAYGAEVTVKLVGGIGVPVIICSPVMLLEASLKANGNFSVECMSVVMKVPVFKKTMSKESIGKKIYNQTEKWRCPDLSQLSQNLRSVASCYEDKNDQVNLEKALTQLDVLKENQFQDNCIDEDEKILIKDQYEKIQDKLKKVSRN